MPSRDDLPRFETSQVGTRWSALLLLCLALSCATPGPSAEPRARFDFTLPDREGRAVSLSSHAGRVVLVDVWATWCKPCERSFPFYAELYQRHRALGFELLAVSVDTDREEVERFLTRMDVPFQVLLDPEGTVPVALGVETMPTAVVIGRDGRVTHVHEGFDLGDGERIEEAVRRAMAGGDVVP